MAVILASYVRDRQQSNESRSASLFFAISSVRKRPEISRCLSFAGFPSFFTPRPPLSSGFLAFRFFGRPAWVDQKSGDPLDYCGSRCAARVQMNHLVGRGVCSLPGCIHKCFIHQQTQEETGYCSEDHRVRATGRMLVSGGWASGPRKEGLASVFGDYSSRPGNDAISLRGSASIHVFSGPHSCLAPIVNNGDLRATATVVVQVQ